MRALASIVVLLLGLNACQSVGDIAEDASTTTFAGPTISVADPTAPAPGPNPPAVFGGAPEDFGDRPPPVIVRAADAELVLTPWTTCWRAGCYRGRPPPVPPHIGDPVEVEVEFPIGGWDFTATATAAGAECGRTQTEPLEATGPITYRLRPIGPAGDYIVTLFGRGPGGSVFVTFSWSSPVDGVLPVPEARASILADHDGLIDSYGIEVPVWNLKATPDVATADALVTSAEGASHRFDLALLSEECGEGMIFFTAPTFEGLTAADLGSAPFDYQIRLRLDGVLYTGTATWPDDVDPECEPCVRLTFDPPLPAMAADS